MDQRQPEVQYLSILHNQGVVLIAQEKAMQWSIPKYTKTCDIPMINHTCGLSYPESHLQPSTVFKPARPSSNAHMSQSSPALLQQHLSLFSDDSCSLNSLVASIQHSTLLVNYIDIPNHCPFSWEICNQNGSCNQLFDKVWFLMLCGFNYACICLVYGDISGWLEAILRHNLVHHQEKRFTVVAPSQCTIRVKRLYCNL